MKYSFTIFKSVFDNKTHKRVTIGSWEEFVQMLFELSGKKGKKAKKGERIPADASPLISPAIYLADTTRANKNVTAWAGWCALDIDNFDGTFDDSISRFDGFDYVCYSTASSTDEQPKFRIVIPLTRHVEPEEIKHLWFALNTHFGNQGDEQTKDLSRMYYVPAKYPNANNFIFRKNGKHLDPKELMNKYEYVEKRQSSIFDKLPPEMQKQILEYREKKLSRDTTWTGYSDCPFVPKRLVSEYKAISGHDGTGRYAMIYKIMTATACNAIKNKFAISPTDIASMIRELDRDTANIYQKRPLETEAERAIEFAYRNVPI